MPNIYKKLLIVDDEPATRVLLSQIFGQMGYSVRTAHDGFAALEMIREGMPDILLSDLNMPGMSGFELLSVVRRRLPAIYVIATSGAYSGKDVPHGIAADSFYEKATGFRFLLSLMEEATQERVLRVQASGASEPMWVSETCNEELDQMQVMIHCPECMRGFSLAASGLRTTGHEFREVDCLYCGSPIYYAIVQPLDPLTSQPYHPILTQALKPDVAPEIFIKAEAELAHGIELVGKRHA